MNTTASQASSKVKKGAGKTSKAVNTNARLSRNKVKKTVAKTKIEAKKMTRKAGTQLNKKKSINTVSKQNHKIIAFLYKNKTTNS